MFYVSLLEPYHRRLGDINIPEYRVPDLIDDDEIDNVEEILKKRKRQGVLEYLVRRAGYPKEYDQ